MKFLRAGCWGQATWTRKLQPSWYCRSRHLSWGRTTYLKRATDQCCLLHRNKAAPMIAASLSAYAESLSTVFRQEKTSPSSPGVSCTARRPIRQSPHLVPEWPFRLFISPRAVCADPPCKRALGVPITQEPVTHLDDTSRPPVPHLEAQWYWVVAAGLYLPLSCSWGSAARSWDPYTGCTVPSSCWIR